MNSSQMIAEAYKTASTRRLEGSDWKPAWPGISSNPPNTGAAQREQYLAAQRRALALFNRWHRRPKRHPN